MKINKCRVCSQAFFDEPLLSYSNMPAAAQFMPDEASLKDEKGVDLEACQCSGCGLVQLSNEPVPYYREVVRAAAYSEEMKAFRIEQFASFVEEYSLEGKKILEVGCGKGEYLSLMQKSGVEAYGLEFSEDSVSHCTKEGLNVSEGFMEGEGYEVSGGPFDAFYTLNFLEHVPDPCALLRGLYNNLTEGGVGFVEVPNFDMMIRNNLFSEFIPDHLFYFTKETLSATLALSGFDLVRSGEVWYDYILSIVVRKRQKTELSSFKDHQESLKQNLDEYIKKYGNKKVAIWGAGHQAFALISLCKLTDKIRYVIDSAPFKQGKFTPATHIPIVPPEAFDKDPVEAIIVMAGSYSDEVAGIIRKRYGRDVNVAIMRDFGLEVL